MILFSGKSADEVWLEAVRQTLAKGSEQPSRGGLTRELLHVGLTLSDPRDRVVFSRIISPAFAVAEAIWILAGANDADFVSFWNPRMRRYVDADNPAILHGAYGLRLGSRPRVPGSVEFSLRHEGRSVGFGRDQLKGAIEALRTLPNSRQVVLQIWDPRVDFPDPAPTSQDVPCNLLSHVMIRNGKLEWLQVMRSNDAVWGLPYNFIQFTTLQEVLAGWLGIPLGSYNHVSDSLHIYERHWQLVEDLPSVAHRSASLPASLATSSYKEWEDVFLPLLEGAVQLTRTDDRSEIEGIWTRNSGRHAGYDQLLALLCAEALAKRGYAVPSRKMIQNAGDYWIESWTQWDALKSVDRADAPD
jgi:thymidylate synthase